MILARDGVRTSLLLCAAAGVIAVLLFRAGSGDDDLVMAQATRGILAWNRSCPTKLSGGLCLADRAASTTRKRTKTELPNQCGPESLGKTTVMRAPDEVARASVALHAAIAIYEQVGKTGGDEAGALHAYIEAKLALADVELERYFALPFPTDLSFDLANPQLTSQSKQRFEAWFTTKRQLGESLRTRYEAIATERDPIATVAAAARLGQIAQNLYDSLLTSPIPERTRTEDAVDSYCDAMVQASEPYEQQTVEAFTSCVRFASQTGLVDTDVQRLRGVAEWSELCANELDQLRPDDFPVVLETLSSDEDRWELARLQIRLRNYDKAVDLLAAITPTSSTAYEHANILAVALRGKGKLAAAEVAYRRAIALDAARPEAYFNLGLLFDYRARKASLDEALADFRKEIPYLQQSAARATGALEREVDDWLAWTQKRIEQIEAFQRATPPPVP
jgi:tetratricopeptide (TPR) repeat protein